MVFFSTIIPVFNRAHLIRATLNSVLHQEFDDQEVIVIDDGSKDRTLDVLVAYSNRIKVLQQENKGPGAARNSGIYHAQGEYIAFLDSDDLWFPWTLSTYEQVIRENSLPAFVVGKAVRFQNEAEIQVVHYTSLGYKYFKNYYASSNQFPAILPSFVAVRADYLREVGGFPDKKINAEDADLWLKFGTKKGFVYIQSPPTCAHRKHADSAMADTLRTYQGICHLIQQEKKGQYPGAAEQQRERIKIITCYVRSTSLACLWQGEIKKGWGLYRDTFTWHVRLKRIRYLLWFLAMAHTASFRSLIQQLKSDKN